MGLLSQGLLCFLLHIFDDFVVVCFSKQIQVYFKGVCFFALDLTPIIFLSTKNPLWAKNPTSD